MEGGVGDAELGGRGRRWGSGGGWGRGMKRGRGRGGSVRRRATLTPSPGDPRTAGAHRPSVCCPTLPLSEWRGKPVDMRAEVLADLLQS